MESLGTITNLHGVIEAARDAKSKFETDLWWRGQTKLSPWKLVPGVYRQDNLHASERSRNLKFTLRAGTRYDKCPAWDDWTSWLLLMQHYRLPTRLLDWTESPLIAAYFAANEHPCDAASLWALSPSFLNEVQSGEKELFHPRDARPLPIFEAAFKEIKRGPQDAKVLAIEAQEVDIRMLVQLSASTIHGIPHPLEELEGKEKFLVRFEIAASSKKEILDDLAGLGITQSRLFPDLEHLASELKSAEFPPVHDKPDTN